MIWIASRLTGLPEAWDLARALRSKVQSSLFRAKKAYITDEIAEANGESSAFWGKIKKIFFNEAETKVDQIVDTDTGGTLEGKEAAN